MYGRDGDFYRRGRYRLTQRAVNGTNLWRVRRIEPDFWLATTKDEVAQ